MTQPAITDVVEECRDCRRTTNHRVAIELRTEGKGENAAFSKEPYRVTRCGKCGARRSKRMNAA
jgi:hypothetical protein